MNYFYVAVNAFRLTQTLPLRYESIKDNPIDFIRGVSDYMNYCFGKNYGSD